MKIKRKGGHGFFQFQAATADVGTLVSFYGDLCIHIDLGAGLVADLSIHIDQAGHNGCFGFFTRGKKALLNQKHVKPFLQFPHISFL